jgi:hypothetical protein
LFFYFFTLGTDWTRFEPDRIHVTQLEGESWSEPVPISEQGYVVWRIRDFGGTAVMTVYNGAGRLYTKDPIPTTVEFWTSKDGVTWGPIDSTCPIVHTGGTETELVEHPLGGWLAVTRKEGPDGFGSDIAFLPSLMGCDWRIRSVPEKLDSPFMFRMGSRVLLIARRTLEFEGAYDLGLTDISDKMRTSIYHHVYWASSKRTALWEIDPDSLELHLITDLPGKGDTCFPAVIVEGSSAFRLYNYTSPLDGRDLPWLAGQLGPTQIYDVKVKIGDPNAAL